MVRVSKLATNPQAEVQGVWHTFCEPERGERGEPFRLKLARITAPSVQAAIRASARNAGLGDDVAQPDRMRAIAPAVAEHVIRDWTGLEDDDGEPLPYSAAVATSILEDPEYHDLYEWVLATSSDAAAYRKDRADQSAKN